MNRDIITQILAVDIPADKKAEIIGILSARPKRATGAADRMRRYRQRMDVGASQWSTLRDAVLKRDGHKCRYCGSSGSGKALHCDHVNPLSKGGRSNMENLVAACGPCNSGKSGRTPDEWKAKQ